ncbi:co-chaperonin GroES [Aedoeadaptatus ivorii]|uniref:Co-chaperonin GroES n=1 Tax=Aedoeadaptatus ivorii TaxID=54006 RepID=A0A448V3C5_9FIRM|nr:co-chaperone GroES [Peptoniphilus ivorii]MDQ0508307.1 chaperonin GroES [Peptoniphilus ivorii]VEJ36281.1 co-chaperonin GroES [Peptoniphilus ivorii]
MNIKPLGERVVIQKIEKENVTAGGIVLPDSAKEESNVATVIAVSEELKNSEEIHCDLKEGDKVIYSKYAGNEVEIDGESVIVIKYQDLLASLS